MSNVWVICQIAFVASLKEIQSRFYLLQFVAKGKCACFFSHSVLPVRAGRGAFYPTADTDHDFLNFRKGKSVFLEMRCMLYSLMLSLSFVFL